MPAHRRLETPTTRARAGSRRDLATWLVAALLFAAVVGPLAFWRLGAIDAVSMEGIVADGARHMDESGRYLVPRLYGEIYAYKPPLAYWLALGSFRVFGESEQALRLPFAASGVAMALVVLLVVGARLGPRAGLVSGLASVTGVLAIQKLRLAEFDMPLAAGVGVAAVLATAELTAERPRAWRWPAAYAALALGFLAKGVPALMFFGPGILAAALATGRWRRLVTLPHLAGVATFALVAGAWILGAFAAEGWAAFEQPLREAGDKGAGWSAAALVATAQKPAVAFAAFFPWTVVALLALRPSVWRRLDPRERALVAAAGAFAAAGVVAFMAVPATETRYLLPIAAPLGVFCGVLVAAAPERLATAGRGLAVAVGLVLALAALTGRLEAPPPRAALVATVGVVLAAGALLLRPRLATARAAAPVVATALALWVLQVYVVDPHRSSSRSLRPVAQAFQPHLQGAGEVWVGPVSAEYRHSSLTFYLRRPVRTFTAESPPPRGSKSLFFSDEAPRLDDAPFDYRVLEERARRRFRFTLVEVETAAGARIADRDPSRTVR